MRIASLILALTGVLVFEATASAQAVLQDDVVYAEKGVYEVGAVGSMSWSNDAFALGAGPSMGWFVEDNLELSALGNIVLVLPDDEEAQLAGSIVFEPSYHLPLTANEDVFGFAGLGAGVGSDGDITGFALIPRVGFNFPLGEGVLTPAARVPVLITEDATSAGVVLELGAGAMF